MTPEEYCQDRAVKSGSSFYYSFLFLAPRPRRAITALYAFCRELDDTVDNTSDSGLAQVRLAWWRNEVAQMYHGTPQHPVCLALRPYLEEFRIKQDLLNEIIEGMQMDLDVSRYRDFENLYEYAFKVASAVGLLAAGIFGYRDESTLKYAENLGIAFQLTNILRDTGEDARRNRIYIPQDELMRFGVSEQDILNLNETDEFIRLMEFQAARANQYYDKALSFLPESDRYSQMPGLIMAAVYRALLQKIRKNGFHTLTGRTRLTPVRKFWITWRTYTREKKRMQHSPAVPS